MATHRHHHYKTVGDMHTRCDTEDWSNDAENTASHYRYTF